MSPVKCILTRDGGDVYLASKKTSDRLFLIGHSFGALSIYKIATMLNKRNFPLLVSFDYSPFYSGVVGHIPDGIVPDNVLHALNYYQDVDPLVRGVRMIRKDGSEKDIQNIKTIHSHVEIDKVAELHNEIITTIKFYL